MNATEVSSADIQAWAEGKMGKQGLPLPTKPRGKDVEFAYPEDPSKLQPIEIGQWLAKFTAWFNYSTSLLGKITSELVTLDTEYRHNINTRRAEVLDDLPARPAGDVVESCVLARHDELTPLYKRRLELLTVREILEARIKIYEKGYQAMSRELTLIGMEAEIQ